MWEPGFSLRLQSYAPLMDMSLCQLSFVLPLPSHDLAAKVALHWGCEWATCFEFYSMRVHKPKYGSQVGSNMGPVKDPRGFVSIVPPPSEGHGCIRR